ncbi:MAG: hypothetical protein JRJ49_03305 [Deltaproteobacteria bacterium]|nr:hypothetical protein [Deltaproteobacteria bacterium]
MNQEAEKYLSQIAQKVTEGQITLFLGAGCSDVAGLPDWKSLTKSIKNKFVDCDQEKNNFFELCKDILNTPGYDRNQLEKFISDKLRSLEILDEYKELCKYNWQSIFTTNYDLLGSVDIFGITA